jgi:hypothetical protein
MSAEIAERRYTQAIAIGKIPVSFPLLGYCLEMICADFFAGVQVESGSPNSLLSVVLRLVRLLPSAQKQAFTEKLTAVA